MHIQVQLLLKDLHLAQYRQIGGDSRQSRRPHFRVHQTSPLEPFRASPSRIWDHGASHGAETNLPRMQIIISFVISDTRGHGTARCLRLRLLLVLVVVLIRL